MTERRKRPIRTMFRVVAPAVKLRLAGDCEIHEALDNLSSLSLPARSQIDVLVTSGSVGATRQDMENLPALRLICTVGTGYEHVDLTAAAERNIVVTNTAGANAAAVAEHAFGLLTAIVRNLRGYDMSVRNGHWQSNIKPPPSLAGKKIGIAGMGAIGTRIGRIAEAFDLDVLYFSRSPKPAVAWMYMENLNALAHEVDFLVLTLPGGPETFHAVDARTLGLLGPTGYLVNVGRGSVVDTGALIEALETGTIAGAGLDVFETEPEPPRALRQLQNVVLTPHVAGVAPEAQAKAADLIWRNIVGVIDGIGPVSPVRKGI